METTDPLRDELVGAVETRDRPRAMLAFASLVDCSMNDADFYIDLIAERLRKGFAIDEQLTARRETNPWAQATPEQQSVDIAALRGLIDQRALIEAIKLVRAKSNAGLAEAKRFVEGLRDGRFESGHMRASLDYLLSRFAEPIEGRLHRETIEQAARRHARDRTPEDGVRLLHAWLGVSADDARAMLGRR